MRSTCDNLPKKCTFSYWSLSNHWLFSWPGPLRVSCGCSCHHGTWDGPQLRHEPRQHRLLSGEGRRRRVHHGRCYWVRYRNDLWANKLQLLDQNGREKQRIWKMPFDFMSNCVSHTVFVLLPRHDPGIRFHACLMIVTWRSWRATWALEEGSVSSTCQTPESCMEGTVVATVTWRMEKNVTVERKRSVRCVS